MPAVCQKWRLAEFMYALMTWHKKQTTQPLIVVEQEEKSLIAMVTLTAVVAAGANLKNDFGGVALHRGRFLKTSNSLIWVHAGSARD